MTAWHAGARLLAESGMSTREIADRLDVTYSAAWKALHPEAAREMVARNNRNRRPQKRAYDRERDRRLRATCDTCGNPCGIGSTKRDTKECMSCRSANSAARDDLIVAMYQEGAPIREMADRLGWTGRGIAWHIGRLRKEGRITGYRYAGWERKQKV